jgi:hypothetical protein
MTDDDWSGTVEMLLRLDADPYSYDDITDNPWPFKIKIGGKRMSTLISRHLVFDSHVCVNIFKSCLLTPMTTPSNGIIFTTNFTPFMNLFCRYTRVLTFFDRYTFPNNSADSVPAAYLTFLDDLLNVPEEGYNWGQVVLSCLYFNLCRSCLEPTDCIAGPVLLLQM